MWGAILLLCLPSAAAPGAAPDWDRIGEETARLLEDLVRIDTTNPPGNETPAATLLARKLSGDHIAAEVFESFPGRGNLYARLPGRGGARPVVLLSHLDVVPADAAGWHLPPFAGVRKNGYL